jgi:hypothetical protein
MKPISIGFACALLVSGHAFAEAIVRARVSPQVVAKGGTFTLSIEATTDEDTRVSSPGPGKTKPFKIVGRSAPTELNQMTVVNGQVDRRTGLSMSWRLEATKEGEFTIGPASADIGGRLVRSAAVKVTVVKAGQLPKKSRDPFFNFFGDDDPFGALRPLQPEEIPAADASLALPKAEGAYIFYRFLVPKTKVVVGELVSLPVYEYEDPSAPRMAAEEIVDPKAPDFVIRAFEGKTKELGLTKVGGEPWKVALVRRWVLAPLRAGRATISSFHVKLAVGGRLTARDTGSLVIDVSEPPAKGRPPGYELGTVGDFKLSAELAPRAIDQGGAVTLSLEIAGVGNFPSKLVMPISRDIEFSEPEVRDNFKFDDQGRYGGTRRLTYVVRLARSGAVALGKVVLPFFDAGAAAYKVAEVDLGTAFVKATASPLATPSPDDGSQAKLASLPEPRGSLEGGPRQSDGSLPAFGALAFGGPFVLALAELVSRVRRWSRSRALRADTPAGRLASARRALAQATAAEVDASIAKVIEAAVALYCGVNVRGLSSDAMRLALYDRSVSPENVTAIVSIMEASEAARFMPGEAAGNEFQRRASDVQALVDALQREKC